MHACRVCDLVLDAAEVELAHSLEAQPSADTPGPIAVPAGLQLMSLVGTDTPMLVSRRSRVQGQLGQQGLAEFSRVKPSLGP